MGQPDTPPPRREAASAGVEPEASTAKAAAWMAGWLLMMTAIAVAGREATRELSVFQVMLLRSLIGLMVLAPLVHAAGGLRAMRTPRLKSHAWRNLVHYAAQYGWLAALALIPLAHVVALEFTMPIWTALLAYAFLGERLGTRKILAIALGTVGVVLIVRPAEGALFSLGHVIALAAAIGFAVSVTMVKSLTRTDTATQLMFWMLVLQSVIGLLPALAHWQTPVGLQWVWILVVGLCGTCSHYCMARAMAHAEATVVVP
ncbi:MAG: DMT family transporter, partial [Rubrivivax sp.]